MRQRAMLMVGPSMKPAMGYVNFVYGEATPGIVAVGDVVGFYRKGKFGASRILHRVINIDGAGFIYIKGDNAPEVDCVTLSKVFFRVERFRKIV